jgi:hypothetical protein
MAGRFSVEARDEEVHDSLVGIEASTLKMKNNPKKENGLGLTEPSKGGVCDRGRDGTLDCPASPSEPDWQISRIRLSG